MDDKTLQALTALAIKLGTTAEHLWGVLVRQAPITGTIDLLVIVAWIVAVVWWSQVVRRKTTVPTATDEDPYPHSEWREEGAFLAWMSVVIAGLLFALIVGVSLADTASAFINPEYWALKQILK